MCLSKVPKILKTLSPLLFIIFIGIKANKPLIALLSASLPIPLYRFYNAYLRWSLNGDSLLFRRRIRLPLSLSRLLRPIRLGLFRHIHFSGTAISSVSFPLIRVWIFFFLPSIDLFSFQIIIVRLRLLLLPEFFFISFFFFFFF